MEITDESITGSIQSDEHGYIIYNCADIYDVTHLELHQNRAGSLFIIGQRLCRAFGLTVQKNAERELTS